MNQTIIQERSGLNQFYAKVYALWDLDWSISSRVSFDVTVFSVSIDLLFDAWSSLVDDCNFAELALVFVASSMAANSPAALQYF